MSTGLAITWGYDDIVVEALHHLLYRRDGRPPLLLDRGRLPPCHEHTLPTSPRMTPRCVCAYKNKLLENSEDADKHNYTSHRQKPGSSLRRCKAIQIKTPQLLFNQHPSSFAQKNQKSDSSWLLQKLRNILMLNFMNYGKIPEDVPYKNQVYVEKTSTTVTYRYVRLTAVAIRTNLSNLVRSLVFILSECVSMYWNRLVHRHLAGLGGSKCTTNHEHRPVVRDIKLTKQASKRHLAFPVRQRSTIFGRLLNIDADSKVREARCPDGLIRGHTYSVTSVRNVKLASGKQKLVRLRNPWGRTEWTGDWCDGSSKWNDVDQDEKKGISLNTKADGEFWMSFNDFCVRFDEVEMTHMCPDSAVDTDSPYKWELSVFMGAWVKGSSAGGCKTKKETFWCNPQYRITLSEEDDEHEGKEGNCNCTLIVALMQKNRRSLKAQGLGLNYIGFAIYHIPDPDSAPRPLDQNFLKTLKLVGHSDSFINMRASSKRFNLSPGTYCIIPSTYHVGAEGEFILRVFTEKRNVMEENDTDICVDEVDSKAAASIEVDPQVTAFFGKIAGEDKQIDWKELQDFLTFALKKDFTFEGLDKKVVRSLIKTIGEDKSRKLNLSEFLQMWAIIKTWKNAFLLHDGGSGQLRGFELREVLNSAGYRVNNKVTDAFMQNYADAEGNIAFIDYFTCCVKLKAMAGLSDPNECKTFLNRLNKEE
ncbi:unnamed protein product [Meganyctiphanes norvegica]|uniref:Calpain catalytic domain-containing protein n=1 Tax=Meganyctiphanes norvegica TaxID=48144 RepID=A0AAV2Q6S0_MEGNR